MRTLTNKEWTMAVLAVCLAVLLILLFAWPLFGPLPAAW
jgi:hypothetical protein